MFWWLLAIFLSLPLVELAILLWLAAHVGWLQTLALVVVTALIGAAEVRREGFRVWAQFHRELSRGRLPTEPLFDGVLLLVAGVLLLTPGIITDLIGFALLVPASRSVIKKLLRRAIERRLVVLTSPDGGQWTVWTSSWEDGRPSSGGYGDDVIDVEYHKIS